MDIKVNRLFQETQKFTQWWLWLFLLAPMVVIVFEVIVLTVGGCYSEPGNFSFSIVMPTIYWIGLLVWFSSFIFFSRTRLEIFVTPDAVKIRHLIGLTKTFKIADIDKAEIVTYGFLGYGIRLHSKYGTVYNVKGNKGLALTLNNGKKYMIGTQRPSEFARAVKKMLG